MTKQTLLEQAKQVNRKQTPKMRHSNEEIELILAWIKGEVGLNQVAAATKRKGSMVYFYGFNVLKQYVLDNMK